MNPILHPFLHRANTLVASAFAASFVSFGPCLAFAQGPLDVVVSPEVPADQPLQTNPDGSVPPFDAFDAYSWRLFIALNWPAKLDANGAPIRGVPDPVKNIADTAGPRVWETWKSASEAVPADGKKPSEWASFEGAPNGGAKELAFAKLGPVFEDLNQIGSTGLPVGSLVAGNKTYVRYEIRMNQKQFDFIRDNDLYLRKTLEERLQQGKKIIFNDQSIEIKAAWRQFKPGEEAQQNRYYHVKARAFDPETGSTEEHTFGLVGFHIAQKTKTRRQWTWSTFEHVDNLASEGAAAGAASLLEAANDAEASDPDGGVTTEQPAKPNPDPTKVRRFRFPPGNAIPPSPTVATNQKWQADPKLRDTVWKNYRLVMTQWPTAIEVEGGLGAPFPSKNVANVTMETYKDLQRSSCITCHEPTPFQTDFVWFLSLRAFTPPPAPNPFAVAPPDPKVQKAKRLQPLLERVQKSAVDAKENQKKAEEKPQP